MSDWLKLAIAATVVALFAGVSIHGPGGASARRAQDKLAARAQASLVAIGASDWARVEMDGQRAVLGGLAPNETELFAARGALRAAVWAGGPLIGGVTEVDSTGARVAPPRTEPYAWRAVLEPDTLELRGAATSRELIDELGRLAGALFPEHRVVNDLVVDPFPPGEGWAEAARGALVVLSHLRVGAAALDDFELAVAGEAASADDARAARASLSRLGDLVSAASSVDVAARPPSLDPPPALAAAPAPAPAVEPDAAPETADPALVLAEPAPAPPPDAAEPEAACQGALADVLAGERILFDAGSATLRPESEALLEEVAAAIAACAPLDLRIEGHTDDTGEETLNEGLSEARAAAVVERLAALGVDPARMTVAGFGASRPVADNATPEGRQANRRIEITVAP